MESMLYKKINKKLCLKVSKYIYIKKYVINNNLIYQNSILTWNCSKYYLSLLNWFTNEFKYKSLYTNESFFKGILF